jgi:hypothetical protein
MSFINALADHIQTNNLGTKGPSLFIGFLPTSATLQTVLTEYTGGTVETFKARVLMY